MLLSSQYGKRVPELLHCGRYILKVECRYRPLGVLLGLIEVLVMHI